MISIKWMGVFVLCQTVFCIEQPYRLVANTTCLEMDDQDRFSCPKSGEYHCLLDENYINEYEVCREWKWIPIGKCAYFNTYNRGNVDERDCEPTPGFTCAPDQHRSTDSSKYTACYVKKETTTQISSISTSVNSSFNGENSSFIGQTTPSNSKQSRLGSDIGIAFGVLIPVILAAAAILLINRKKLQFCKKDNTEISEHTIDIEGQPSEREQLLDGNKQETEQKLVEYINEDATSSKPLIDNKNENNTNDLKQENEISPKISELDDSQKGSSSPKSENGSAEEIPGNHTKENSNTESPEENKQLISPSKPPVQTDYLSKAGLEDKEKGSNEHGEKQGSSPMPDTKEKTESESTKKDENQSKGKDLYKPDLEKEVVNESDEKTRSSDDSEEKTEMESIKEDNNQSERKGNEDNKEDASTDKEESGGVFDDTLESIKKEDDAEKGGSGDLQDFLQEVSTRLAKKMLYDVLKNYVTDPQSYYLTDESKIDLVKELLPTEYQKAVSIDSDDKKSITVIYAILQLALEEEHRPKSGWGQGVKDTDIGVGDDVERLYRVHSLYRDIADPEQISLTGYTRLFKVLFEAVDRLDKKGKCKEDYQEFVRRWENLQRNQWYKDNLNALWSVIQKWSL